MRIADASIRRKLFLFYLISGVVPLVLIGLLGLRFASDALLDKSADQLITVQSLRKARIEHDFAMRLESVKRLNQRNDVINLFTEIAALRASRKDGGLDVAAPDYRAIVNRFTPSLRHYLATYTYRDLLLLGADGRGLYSRADDPGLGSSLDTGLLRDSGLARLWQRISVTRQTAIVDFSPYADGSHAAFIGQPYFGRDGRMAGVVALRMGPELVDAIVTSRAGMGQTGESYILSFDKEKSRFEFRTTVQTTGAGRWTMGTTLPRPLAYWDKARDAKGVNTVGQYADSEGNPVLVAHDGLDIPHVEW
jgi:tubulin-specific chaperone A